MLTKNFIIFFLFSICFVVFCFFFLHWHNKRKKIMFFINGSILPIHIHMYQVYVFSFRIFFIDITIYGFLFRVLPIKLLLQIFLRIQLKMEYTANRKNVLFYLLCVHSCTNIENLFPFCWFHFTQSSLYRVENAEIISNKKKRKEWEITWTSPEKRGMITQNGTKN